MAEEYCEGPNWWDSTTTNRSRLEGGGGGGGGGGSSSTCSTTTLANTCGGPTYGWLTEGSTAKLDASSLQLVGLGLSSHAMPDWNQQQTAILRNPEKGENSFRSMLQHGGVMFGGNNNNNTSELHEWRSDKLFSSNEDSSSDFKQIGRGFSLDNQHQFSPSGSSIESSVTCQGLATPSSFQLDSSSTSSVFGNPPSILQGLMGNEQHQINSNYQQNYFGMGVSNDHQQQQSQLSNSWSKVPQFLRTATSPKQQHHHLINSTPYWSASSPLSDVRPNFFSNNMPTFQEKPKTTMEVRDTSCMVKKNSTENNTKRTRNDGASSTLPPFKVRKEKMGDRITALQQLVSPFGKTDTASVLSEAIEYIKFLHEQVSVLSNPYLKSGGSYQQHQQGNEKVKTDPDGPKQDLRSRGLCLVPISSTFPVTHETTVDFWTPTFGGTFR